MSRADPAPAATTDPATPEAIAPGALAQAVGAYLIWGVLPLYFKAMGAVPALEVVAHRIVWSVLLLVALLWLRGRLPALGEALVTPRLLRPLIASALLIAANWLIYIWAVGQGQIVAASLGYFLNPLLNVVLGYAVLKERLSPPQWVAVGLAVVGVAVLGWGAGWSLWISLGLAGSFGVYGLIRKVAAVGPMVGLAAETIVLAPVALLFLGGLALAGTGAMGSIDTRTDLLLLASGVITATPLLLFASAARRMKYATIGLIQYIGPTIQLVIAVWLYDEPLTLAHHIAFFLIWGGLALYSWDAWRRSRAQPVTV